MVKKIYENVEEDWEFDGGDEEDDEDYDDEDWEDEDDDDIDF